MIVAIGVGAAAQGPTSASFPASPEAPLADAERRQDKQVVLSLLAKKADVNARQPDGATALHWAAYADDAETTALLIRAGANVNVANDHGVSPFAIAARQGNANILGQLMKAGADPNDKLNEVNSGETPLMHAARSAVPAGMTADLAGAR
jgi:ankyrin repeat protein